MSEERVYSVVHFSILVLSLLCFDFYCVTCSTPSPHEALNTGTLSGDWPSLGAKKPQQQQPINKINQQNNQQKVDPPQNTQNTQLSYTNSNQNQKLPQRLNSPNYGGAYSGLSLSYGPGQAVIVPQNSKTGSNSNLNQNSNLDPNKKPNLNQNQKTNVNQNQQLNVNQNQQPNVNQKQQPNLNQNQQSNVNQNHKPNLKQNQLPNLNQNQAPNLNQNQKPNLNQNQKPNLNQNQNPNINQKPNLNQNALQGVWSNSGKTQQVVNNLATSTTIKPSITPTTSKLTVPNQSSTPGAVSSTVQKTTVTTEKSNSDDEQLRQFFEQLIKKDSGNAVQYVTANYQGKTTSRSTVDEAPQPLLNINPAAYQLPSVSKLLALHNNYILETNVNEHITPQERIEENDLLDEIVNTPVMQAARNFLIEKGVVTKDPKNFRDKLKEIWFTMYSRGGGRIGSSGFEHVFLAEIKNTDVTGLHNWIYFKDAEAKGLANYLGYMKKFDLGNKGSILKYHFTFNGYDKPVGSMFIGTSPELEIALYSTCFLLRPDQVCPMRFDGHNFIIRTYTFRYRGKNMIGSAFPEI